MDKLSLDFQTPDVDTLSTVMILTPPVDFHSPDALEIFEVSDTLRLKTPIHDGAPHGRYIVEDGDKRFLFRFFKGDDINQALADAKANLARTDSEAQQTQRGTDPQPTGQSDVNLVAVPGAAALSTFANTARATVTSALSALTSAGALGGDHTPPPRFGYSRMGQRSSTLREGPSEAPVAQGPQPLPFAPQWPHQAAPGPAGYNPTLGQPQYLQPPYHDLPPYYYPQPQQASMPPPSEQPPPAQAQEPPARAQEPPIQSPNQQRSSRSQQVQQRSSRSQSRQPAAVQTQQRSSRSHSRQHPSRTQQPHTQPQRPLVQQPPVLSQQPQTSVVATVVSQTPRVVPSQAPQAVGPSVQGFVQGRLANSLIPIGSIDQTTDGMQISL